MCSVADTPGPPSRTCLPPSLPVGCSRFQVPPQVGEGSTGRELRHPHARRPEPPAALSGPSDTAARGRRPWTPEARPALRGPPAPPVRPSSFICPATQQLRSAFQRRLRTPKYPLNSSRAPCSRGGGAELKPHVGAFGGPPPKAQARARGPPRIGLSPGLGLGIKTSRWRGVAPCSSRAGWGRPVRKGTTRSRLPPVLSEPVCASHVSQRPRKTLA